MGQAMMKATLQTLAAAALLSSCTQADWDEAYDYFTKPDSVSSAHVAH